MAPVLAHGRIYLPGVILALGFILIRETGCVSPHLENGQAIGGNLRLRMLVNRIVEFHRERDKRAGTRWDYYVTLAGEAGDAYAIEGYLPPLGSESTGKYHIIFTLSALGSQCETKILVIRHELQQAYAHIHRLQWDGKHEAWVEIERLPAAP